MIKKKRFSLLVYAAISVLVFVFYLFYVNFSTDTLILFVTQKLFLGRWLAKGIVPFFNPHLFAGIPFMFDVGLGNFHPINLLFILPYPFSFAFAMALTTFLFLVGFHLLFGLFSKDEMVALFCTLILFFSGNGTWRFNNPTVYFVICHYGFLLYFLKSLEKKNWSLPFLITGFLMTLAGHIQFVFYGYMMIVLVGLFFMRVPFKKLLSHLCILFLLTCWYYVLSLPLVLSSTRMTTHPNYAETGPMKLVHFVELVFPYFFGSLRDGSSWNAGIKYELFISIVFLPMLFLLFMQRKIKLISLALFGLLFLVALGKVQIPFLRGAAQIFVVIHILGLLVIASHARDIILFLKNKMLLRIYAGGFVTSSILALFFLSPLFARSFLFVYAVLKHGAPSLFFDFETVRAIGGLMGKSMLLWVMVFAVLFFGVKFKRDLLIILMAFVAIEGLFFFYQDNFFIPQSSWMAKMNLHGVNSQNYRIQTGSDVIPYFGFHNYMGGMLFRPPFSKEPTMLTKDELHSFSKLNDTMQYMPLNTAMLYGLKTIQGYNTFVTKKIAMYFRPPSSDYKEEYKAIIKRNSYYGQSEVGLDTNGIETSKITLNDIRWANLAVRFFLTDRPRQKYKLVSSINKKYVYENMQAPPISGIVTRNNITPKSAYYEDPNQMKFFIKKNELGKTLQIIIDSDGFDVKYNNKPAAYKKTEFKILVPLTNDGNLTIYYSPLKHLQETLYKYRRKI